MVPYPRLSYWKTRMTLREIAHRALVIALLYLVSPHALAEGSHKVQASRGGIAVLTAPEEAVGATLNERNLRMLDGKIFVGIPYYSNPGTTLTVVIERRDGSSLEHTIEIVDKKFRESHITVATRYAAPDPEAQERIRREQKLIDRARARFSPTLDPRTSLALPVEGVASSPFGVRRFINGKERSAHRGHDIAAPTGTPVVAPLGGVVVLVHELFYTGKTIIIDHGMGTTSMFAHLDSYSVAQGDMVLRGTPIGTVGSTGRSTGPHLHWGLSLNGELVDPLYLVEE